MAKVRTLFALAVVGWMIGAGAAAETPVVSGFADPESLVEQLVAASDRRDLRGLLRMYEPSSLEVIKTELLKYRPEADEVGDGDDAAEYLDLVGVEDWKELESLSGAELLARFYDRLSAEKPSMPQETRRITVLGYVRERDDLLHYVVRRDNVVTARSVQHTPDGWFAVPGQSLSELITDFTERLASRDGAAEHHEASSAPVEPSEPSTPPIVPTPDMVQPRLVEKITPAYPQSAIEEHLEGRVILQAVIDVEGHVSDARVMQSSNARFEAPAINAVRQWRYTPALRDGKPVAVYFTIVVEFEMGKD